MSLKFITVPQKRLVQGITSTSSTFYINNILSFDGLTDIVPADLGTIHYCAFRNDNGSILELMEIDPSTISTGPITITKRGLKYNGDLTTEDPDLKYDWPANTIVMLGTDVPQIFEWLKEYIDNIAIAGSPDATTMTKGIGKVSVTPANPSLPIFVGDNDPRVPDADPVTLFAKIKVLNDTITYSSSATPTIDTDLNNRLTLTAQVENISSMTSGLSGSPLDGDKLSIRMTNGLVQASLIGTSNLNTYESQILLDKPINTTDGDIMFSFIGVYGTTMNTVPSGWTLLDSKTNENANFYLYWKMASSEGSNYNWALTTAANFDSVIVTYRSGFKPNSPIKSYTNTTYNANDNKIRAAGLTTSAATTCLVFAGYADNVTNYISADPAGWTIDFTEGTQQSRTLRVARKTFSAGDATGNVDFTLSGSTTGEKHAFMVELDTLVSITWGTSYQQGTGSALPTTLPIATTQRTILEWNSLTNKWETI